MHVHVRGCSNKKSIDYYLGWFVDLDWLMSCWHVGDSFNADHDCDGHWNYGDSCVDSGDQHGNDDDVLGEMKPLKNTG